MIEWIRTNPFPNESFELKQDKDTILEMDVPMRKLYREINCKAFFGKFDLKMNDLGRIRVMEQGEEIAHFKPIKWLSSIHSVTLQGKRYYKKVFKKPARHIRIWELNEDAPLISCSLEFKGKRGKVDFQLDQKLLHTKEGMILSAIAFHSTLNYVFENTLNLDILTENEKEQKDNEVFG